MTGRCWMCGRPRGPSADGLGSHCRRKLATHHTTARPAVWPGFAQPALEEPVTTETTPALIADPQMEDTHYGIPVAHIGEDGEMLALGHHSTRRALAAFNRHARDFAGLTNLADDGSARTNDWASAISQRWAIFRKPDPQWEDPDYTWVADWSNPDAPGARPVTLLRP